MYVAAGLVFTSLDAVVKGLASSVPVVDLVWARSIVFFALFLALSARRDPRRLVRTKSPILQVARAGALFGATATFFVSLSVLPLGEVSALGSASPLIVVALAGPLLHERVARAAIAGSVMGFVGVIILIGFDPAGFDFRLLLPLGTAASYAAFSLLSRAVGHEPEDVTLFFTGLFGLIFATATVAVVQPTAQVTTTDWLVAGGVGAISLAGHHLLVRAYRRGTASDLAPFGYLGLIWSFLLGAVVFGEPIEPQAALGAGAIALGGLIAIRGVAGESPETALAVQAGHDVATDEAGDEPPHDS